MRMRLSRQQIAAPHVQKKKKPGKQRPKRRQSLGGNLQGSWDGHRPPAPRIEPPDQPLKACDGSPPWRNTADGVSAIENHAPASHGDGDAPPCWLKGDAMGETARKLGGKARPPQPRHVRRTGARGGISAWLGSERYRQQMTKEQGMQWRGWRAAHRGCGPPLPHSSDRCRQRSKSHAAHRTGMNASTRCSRRAGRRFPSRRHGGTGGRGDGKIKQIWHEDRLLRGAKRAGAQMLPARRARGRSAAPVGHSGAPYGGRRRSR